MDHHKRASEPRRTAPRSAPAPTVYDDFLRHFEATRAFSAGLREARCRATDHFTTRLGETVQGLRPLFAPWNVEIVFALSMHGPQRFSALKRGLGGISSRVLTDKLRALAELGLVAREEAAGAVTYGLTTRGEDVAILLHPIVFLVHNPDARAHSSSVAATRPST